MNKFSRTIKKAGKKNTKKNTKKNGRGGGWFPSFCKAGSPCADEPPVYLPYTYDDISNGEIIAFVLKDLITDQQIINLGNIINKNIDFINSIESVNTINPTNNCPVSAMMSVLNSQKIPLDYEKNEKYRSLLNDIIQWLLFDYSNILRVSLFEIIYQTFLDNNFLSTVNDNTNYDILLKNTMQVIMLRTNDINSTTGVSDPQHEPLFCAITLLRIILKFLKVPETTTLIMSYLNPNQTIIQQFRKTILCIVKYVITTDLTKNNEVRILISDYIKDMTLHRNFSTLVTVLKKSVSLIGNCSGTLFLNLAGYFVPLKN